MAESSDRIGLVAQRLRHQRGESLRQVAKRAGMSDVQLKRVEDLKSSPTEEKIRGLGSALEVPVSVLFGEQASQPQQVAEASTLHPQVPLLARGSFNFPSSSDDQEHVLDEIRNLLSNQELS